jgi:hypothetical protein
MDTHCGQQRPPTLGCTSRKCLYHQCELLVDVDQECLMHRRTSQDKQPLTDRYKVKMQLEMSRSATSQLRRTIFFWTSCRSATHPYEHEPIHHHIAWGIAFLVLMLIIVSTCTYRRSVTVLKVKPLIL